MNIEVILFFLKNRAVYKIMWKNVVEPDRPYDKMAHAHYMLNK
jgi:hypothetical protein